MSTIEISGDDISGLAEALDGLNLPDGQKALLSAIVMMAAHAMAVESQQTGIVDGADVTSSFKEQFAAAFTAGSVVDVAVASNLKLTLGKIFKIGQ